jgi:DNA topoisomerase VI subunit B
MPNKRKPMTTAEMSRAVRFLQRHGLSIYGPNVDVGTGQGYGGYRDYNTGAQVMRFARHVREGTIKEPTDYQ